MSGVRKKAKKVNKKWEAEIKLIDKETNMKYDIFKEHHRTFNSFLCVLDNRLRDIEPSVRLYRKKDRVGSIYYNPTNISQGLYTIKLYMVHDMSEVLTIVSRTEGNIQLSTNHKMKWSHRKGTFRQEEFYLWMQRTLDGIMRDITERSDTLNRLLISVARESMNNMDLLIRRRGKDAFMVNVIPALKCTVSETMEECMAILETTKDKLKVWRLKYHSRERELICYPHFNTTLRMVKLIRETYDMLYIPKHLIKIILIIVLNDSCLHRDDNVHMLTHMIHKLERVATYRELLDEDENNILSNYTISDDQLVDSQKIFRGILKRLDDNKDSVANIIFNIEKGKKVINDDNDIKEIEDGSSTNITKDGTGVKDVKRYRSIDHINLVAEQEKLESEDLKPKRRFVSLCPNCSFGNIRRRFQKFTITKKSDTPKVPVNYGTQNDRDMMRKYYSETNVSALYESRTRCEIPAVHRVTFMTAMTGAAFLASDSGGQSTWKLMP